MSESKKQVQAYRIDQVRPSEEVRFVESADQDAGLGPDCENIDLSKLDIITELDVNGLDPVNDSLDILNLNKRYEIQHPKPGDLKIYNVGGHVYIANPEPIIRQPQYRTLSGQICRPSSFECYVLQNPVFECKDKRFGKSFDNGSDSGSYTIGPTYRMSVFDPCNPGDKFAGRDWLEGYYDQVDKSAKWEHIAEIDPECHRIVESIDPARLEFVCPKRKPVKERLLEDPWLQYNITIYINPANGQARWYCPHCNTGRDPNSYPILHEIRDRATYDRLAEAGILPEHKTKNNESRWPELIEFVKANKKKTMNQIDLALNWHPGTTKRILDAMGDYDSRLSIYKDGSKTRLEYN